MTSSRPVVCQIVHTLNVGGAELLARQFAQHAVDEFDFVFVCLDSAGLMAEELKAAGYTVEVLGRKPGFDLGCMRRLAKIFRQHQVRVVHAHQYAPFFYAAMARGPLWSKPLIIFTEHGRDYPDFRRGKRVLANRLLLGRRDRVIGVGQCVCQALVKYEGISPLRVEAIYNGIDTAAYASAPTDRQRMRQSLGLADDEIALIQVARLNRLKDHATAVRAFAQVVARFPQARLLIAGDGEEREAIESLVSELGLQQSITLLGTRRDVAQLLSAADVFLLTSVSEGIPLTLIEAMAAGLPCVSTDVGGTGEVILPETGLLACAGDPADVASRIVSLLEQPQLMRSMGAAGKVRAVGHFDSSAMHAAYRQLYRELSDK